MIQCLRRCFNDSLSGRSLCIGGLKSIVCTVWSPANAYIASLSCFIPRFATPQNFLVSAVALSSYHHISRRNFGSTLPTYSGTNTYIWNIQPGCHHHYSRILQLPYPSAIAHHHTCPVQCLGIIMSLGDPLWFKVEEHWVFGPDGWWPFDNIFEVDWFGGDFLEEPGERETVVVTLRHVVERWSSRLEMLGQRRQKLSKAEKGGALG